MRSFGLVIRVLLACCLGSGAAAAATTYTTTFELSEKPISEQGAWRRLNAAGTPVATAGGLAFGTQTGSGGFDDSYAYLSGFPPNQAASAVVHLDKGISTNTTHEVEILLRWSDSADGTRGYECNFAYNGQYQDIVRWNGPKGSFTYLVPTLTASIPGGLHDGDTVSAQIVGKTITTFVNGKKILSVDDDTFKDGNPGMGFFRGAPSGPQTDFALTQFTATSSVVRVPATLPTLARPSLGVLLGLLLVAAAVFTLQRRASHRADAPSSPVTR